MPHLLKGRGPHEPEGGGVTFHHLLQLVVPADAKAASRLKAVIKGLWFLACANALVLFFVQGGYDIEVGPVHLHASSLRNWLALCLALSLSKAWLEERLGARSVYEGLQSPWLLFIGTLTVYYANGHTFETGDTLPARVLPVSLLIDHDFYLDRWASTIEAYDDPYFARSLNGHLVSTYPPWGAVLSLPAYVIPVLKVGARLSAEMLFDLEKRASMLTVALSVFALFAGLRRVARPRVAWCIAVVYAFGTSSLSLISQAAWQHGPSQLFLSLTLYCLVRSRETPIYVAWAGLALGWAVICRPVNLLMALPIALYVLHKHRGQCIGFLLAGVPPLLLFLWYNDAYFGSPVQTGFGATVVTPASLVGRHLSWFSTPFFEGLVGVLFSPARGLFIYSPIFLCSLAGMVVAWREPGQVFLRYLSVAPLLLVIPVATLGSWWGGHGYGPRLLADSAPVLCYLMVPIFDRIGQRAWMKYMVVGLAGFSIGMHAIGFAYSGDWGSKVLDFDTHPERVWCWRESPPVLFGTQLLEQVWQTVAMRF
ncbi:glycosyltransferase family 39 protein [Nitrospira lenta]|uniref:Uncharacterized protein n=1 Tax=Nitrospira lenta TaxID=1436998 RepID=A0A330L360_9BACT|nr:glycosyltransferase family 39 protein [Nitrospira lenta]SPP63643.1 membrane hypothetical protein [Nitrospira lenta]